MPALQILHAFAVILHVFFGGKSSAKAWHPMSMPRKLETIF